MTSDQFAALYIAESRSVYRFLRWCGASREVAEDLAGDTWVVAWQHRDEWRGFRGWLFTVARNLYYMSLRNRPSQLPDYYAGSYQEDFESQIAAQQILSMCSKRESQLLREGYMEDRQGPLSATERTHLFRARHSVMALLR